MQKLFYAFYSLSKLKVSQLYYLALYRVWGFRRVESPVLPGDFQSSTLYRLLPHQHQIVDPDVGNIRLLNHSVPFSYGRIDWAPKDCSRLWRYHLHYFDFLHQLYLPEPVKSNFIEDWLRNNPQGACPAWEPYTVSLRIVNWTGYFGGRQVPLHWSQSLYTQVRWLRANLEYHILANHYFENIKALVFAAFYFRDLQVMQDEVAEWKSFALRQLEEQLQEQFFSDGGHYERSPMYHNIMIKNCLELLAAFRNQSERGRCERLEEVIKNGLVLALKIARPDGEIPLFNDSVLHHGPATADLIAFARELQVVVPTDAQAGDLTLVQAHETGIYGVRVHNDWLMMDCGDVGPQYQPGHTHCDFLSYELVLGGLLLIVDSGVYEYEVGSLRHQLRSTSAHNTIRVNGLEQSEIWSAFRVARRAKKLRGSIERQRNLIQISGAYRGFYRGANWSVHTRQIGVVLDAQESQVRAVHFHDEVEHRYRSEKECTGFIHFHPDVILVHQEPFQYGLRVRGQLVANIRIENAADVMISPSLYAPEFGLRLNSQKLVVTARHNCITYSIQNFLND